MSGLLDCCAPCPAVQTVNVPGEQGDPGSAGTDGTNGVNAFTTTAADFVIPAINSNVTVSVGNSTWMAIGQNVFSEEPANFEVVSLPGPSSVELKFLGYTGDAAPGATISAGSKISPAGLQGTNPFADPIPIANGGTGSATKGAAQAALGLGQDITQLNSDALAYDVTNSYASTGAAVAVVTTGLYLIIARATVLFTGVTFASSRTLSLRVRNTTQTTTHSETVRATNVHTTTSFPAIDYCLPVVAAQLTAGDILQIQAQLDTVESAGSTVITSGSLAIIPLALA